MTTNRNQDLLPNLAPVFGYRAAEPQSQHSIRVMFIDDQPEMRDIFSKGLRALGCEVLTVESADEALQVVRNREHPVDLIVTDLAMPRMNGVQFVVILRQMEVSLPVIAYSGNCWRYLKTPSDQNLFEAIIEKPATFLLLKDAIIRTALKYRTFGQAKTHSG